MTLEERVAQLEKELELEKKKVTDQNSYITKLEAANKNSQQGGAQVSDALVTNYVEKQMRKEILADVSLRLKALMGDQVYAAVEKDYIAFLDANMTREKISESYAWDAFFLVLGRCQKDPTHPIQAVKASPQPGTTPPQGPQPQGPVRPGTNGQAVQAAQSQITPPVAITGKDGGATPPPDQTKKPGTVKDSFSVLAERLNQAGANRFK